jgi:DNA-binding transcriptional ArsR family regulator
MILAAFECQGQILTPKKGYHAVAIPTADFKGESEIKRRLRGYFSKYPGKEITTKQLSDHFNDVTNANLGYHLRTLIDQGMVEVSKRGIYHLNPKYQSLEEKRLAVAQHIAENPRVVQSTEGFSPLKPALTVVENPSAVGNLATGFAASIVARMRSQQPLFTDADCEFIEHVVKERYTVK